MFGIRGINVFLFVIFYSILPIIYLVSRNEWKAKKNIMLGVTLPKELRESEEADRVGKEYKRELNRTSLILAAAGLPALFIRYTSVSLTWDLVWMTAVIIMPGIVYIRGWKKLKVLKNALYRETEKSAEEYIDLSAAENQRKAPSLIWYILPMVISIIPCLLTLTLWGTKTFWWMESCYLALFGCILFLVLITRKSFDRQQPEMVDSRIELTAALTKVRRDSWHRMIMWISWLTAFFSLVIYIALDHPAVLLAASAVYSVILIALAFHAEFSVRRTQEKLTKDCGEGSFADEDQFWLYGCIYYNSSDRHVLKNTRTGMNMTFNLATGAGKAFAVFTVLIILLMPFMGVWMIAEEFIPIKVVIRDDTVLARHLKQEYEIDLTDILSAEVITELPRTRKDVGTAMDTVYKGQFRVDGYGTCELFLDPRDTQFIVIDTEDERYIFSMDDEVQERVLRAAGH